MRKLLFLFIAVFAFSCSSDDGGNTTNPEVTNPEPENPGPVDPNPTDCIYSTSVLLKTQSEVDAFAANNYCIVEGNLFIGYLVGESGSSDITNLSGLLNLKEVTGQLVIWLNGELVNLHGLENLQKVKTLSIVRNDKLETLEHLQSLTVAASYGNTDSFIQIGANYALKDIMGLKQIESAEKLMITSNRKLLNLNGLQALKKTKSLTIDGNGELLTFEGLQNLVSVNTLEINWNTKLASIQHLSNLKEISLLDVSDNESLTSLRGLEQITKIEKLFLYRNAALTSLDGCDGLIEVNYMHLESNSSMTSLQGLQNLKTLSAIYISYCPLSSLAGLNNVSSFVDYSSDSHFFKGISISVTKITSLSGLQNITSFVGGFEIQSNSNLTDFCAINNIVTPTTPFTVENNAYNPTKEDILAGNCSQ